MPSLDPTKHHNKSTQPPFCFSKGRAKAQVYGLSLACRFWLDFCACSLAVHQSSLLPPQGVHTENLPQGVCVGGEGEREGGGRHTEHWGTHVPAGGSPWARLSQRLMGGLLDGVYTTVSRIFIPLMPSAGPICSSPASSHPKWQLTTQESAWGKRGLGLLGNAPSPTPQAGKAQHLLTCSHFTHWRNHGLRRCHLAWSCGTLGEGWRG